MKNLLLLAAGLGIVSPGIAQNINEYKLSDSKIISTGNLINLLGNIEMNIKCNNKNYLFTTQDLLNYFVNKPFAEFVGQEDYDSFLNVKPYKSEDCKCDLPKNWVDGKEVTFGVDVYSIGLSNRMFNSPLNKMFNGIPVLYNSNLKQLEELASDTNKLIKDFNNSGYKLLLTLTDFVSPEEIRIQKNKGSTCYIMVDNYDWLILSRFFDNGMKIFLEQLPRK